MTENSTLLQHAREGREHALTNHRWENNTADDPYKSVLESLGRKR